MSASEDKKRLLSNFFSLSVLQGMNMLLPLITLPYIVQALGTEKFGLINFSLSIIMYLFILVSFGFELSATRKISMVRENTEKVQEIFSSVIIIKFFLVMLSLIILTSLILSFDMFYEYASLYYVTFGIVVGNLLFPTWLFQGMENMKYITYINFVIKILFTVLIFVLVKTSEDFIYVPMLNSLGAILGGLYSLLLIPKLFKIKLIIPPLPVIVGEFKESIHFFLSRLANNGSRFYATTIIGIVFGNTIVGYYTMVEKLYYAFLSLGGIVSQTIYPYMSRTRNLDFFKKIVLFVAVGAIVIIIPLYYYHKEMLFLLFSIDNEMLSNNFMIMFSVAVIGVVTDLLGYPLLAAFGYNKHANNSLIYASFFYVVYISIAAFVIKDIYFVTSSVIVYVLVTLCFRIYYINKVGLFKNHDKVKG
jgi:PST family polysaccharide transporter